MKKLLSILPFTLLTLNVTAMAETSIINDVPLSTLNEDIEFPDSSRTYLKELPRYDPIELIHIDRGISDDTVRQLIGNPHFSEFISSNWNYIFDIREPNTRNYIQCQLQLHFDKSDVVENYYWNSSECANLVNDALKPAPAPISIVQPATITIEKPTPVALPKVRTFTLSSDLLFDFDSAQLKSSSALSIDKLTSTIQQEYRQVDSIKLVGYTDYLGDAEYNKRLSTQRANTVQDELVRRGFNPDSITVSGRGESAPLTNNCQNMSLKQAKLCLAPDRRVEVQVVGDLK